MGSTASSPLILTTGRRPKLFCLVLSGRWYRSIRTPVCYTSRLRDTNPSTTASSFEVTPLALMAMTLERYVAICIPLRHGELCSTRNSLHSSIPRAVMLCGNSSFTDGRVISSYKVFMHSPFSERCKDLNRQHLSLEMCAILPNTYVRMLFVDFSSAFNTVIPDKVILKLHNLGLALIAVPLDQGLPHQQASGVVYKKNPSTPDLHVKSNLTSDNMPKIQPQTKLQIIKSLKTKSAAEAADIFNVSKRQEERIRIRLRQVAFMTSPEEPVGTRMDRRFTQKTVRFGGGKICNINSLKYQENLAAHYIPNHKRGQILQQDGAPSHTSASTLKFLKAKKVKLQKDIAESFYFMNSFDYDYII
ncbi:hypothetical protein L3Q82_018665 [Scortum barcoo]|uniref:Uncharacterized protein n=1 Tax=Scortum barcoo TaxID=214431 RepID=A0ACB8VHS9_9TELE|nr:hypothetical protein L3Q82_018665 [Scortum barcoo]